MEGRLEQTMFRVTIQSEAAVVRVVLEGSLTGPYVQELQRCWQAHSLQPRSVVVDLTEITFMDPDGKTLLAQMHGQGAQLVGRGVMTTAWIEEISLTAPRVSPSSSQTPQIKRIQDTEGGA